MDTSNGNKKEKKKRAVGKGGEPTARVAREGGNPSWPNLEHHCPGSNSILLRYRTKPQGGD